MFQKKKKRKVTRRKINIHKSENVKRSIGESYSYLTFKKNEQDKKPSSYANVFKVTNKYGNNHDRQGVSWASDLIGRATPTADIITIEKFRKISPLLSDEIENKKLDFEPEKKSNSDKQKTITVAKLKNYDRSLFSSEMIEGRRLVVTNTHMFVKAKFPRGVDNTIKNHRQNLVESELTGVRVSSKVGSTLSWFKNLFKPLENSNGKKLTNEFIETSSMFAQRMSLVQKGFNDDNGTIIGNPVFSETGFNPMDVSIMDLDGFSGQVLIGGSSTFVPYISLKDRVYHNNFDSAYDSKVSGASLTAQTIANQSWIKGKKIYHILLNSNFPKGVMSDDAKYFNMEKEAINPLEVYGFEKTLSSDFNDNIEKLVVMTLLLMKSNFEDGNLGDQSTTNLIKEVILNFYSKQAGGNGMWIDPDRNLNKARTVLATKEGHKNFPKYAELINGINNYLNEAKAESDEEEKRRIKDLYRTLSNTLETNRNLINKATTLPDFLDNNHNQVYYDLSASENNPSMQMAQLINLVSYLTATVRQDANDIIVFHGAEKISKDVVPLLSNYRKRLLKQRTRIIWSFDENGFDEDSKKNKTISALDNKKIFGEISKDIDYFIFSKMTDKSVSELNQSLGNIMPETAISTISKTKDKSLVYISRQKDGVNGIISLDLYA